MFVCVCESERQTDRQRETERLEIRILRILDDRRRSKCTMERCKEKDLDDFHRVYAGLLNVRNAKMKT